MKRGQALALGIALISGACKPTSVSDAEAKNDVGYLVGNGSPEAVAALGRLADKNDKARAALQVRAENDVNAYIAAWSAVQRGAAWGSEVLRAGIGQPARAELAASAMARGDAHLTPFVPDLASALVAAGPRETRMTVAAMLASTGASAVVAERLKDKTTRANMCRGLASPDASAASRETLLKADEASRDDPACLDAVVRLAMLDDAALVWLAQTAEPGLLSGAGKLEAMPCPRLAKVWTQAFDLRPATAYTSLAVPLAHAVKRCPTQMDEVLDAALAKNPGTAPLVTGGVDPYGSETRQLKKTCAALGGPALRGATGRTRDRAADALANGCKGARAPGK